MLNLSRVVNLLFIVLNGSIFGLRAVNFLYAASRGTRGVSFRARRGGFTFILRARFASRKGGSARTERESTGRTWERRRYRLFNTAECLSRENDIPRMPRKTDSRKATSEAFAVTASEEGRCARARAREEA